MSPARIQLVFQPRATLLAPEAGPTATLALSPESLVADAIRHQPPRAAELEHAIDLVEDALAGALAGALAARSEGGELLTADPWLCRLPGLAQAGATLEREAVEQLFQRLASRALGTPVPEAEFGPERELAAALLLLRECMHHLGFARVKRLDA